jgi:HPt (histidine-containing phosphotransfer) domain-containing protein
MMKRIKPSVICLGLTWLLAIGVPCGLGRAAVHTSPANRLPNPSFEQGRSKPDRWLRFGLCDRNWGLHGHTGERCVSVTGDGANSGWWLATGWGRVEYNRVYRASCWARGESDVPGGEVLFGPNVVTRNYVPDSQWRRYEYYLRSPSHLPGFKFWLGQKEFKGTLYFDDVALLPVVAIHRSGGRAGVLSLGAGERLVAGEYTAVHDLDTLHTSDCRFLDSFTAELHNHRWVLDRFDEVVYHHEISRLGMPRQTHGLRGAAAAGMQAAAVEYDARLQQSFAQARASFTVTLHSCAGGGLLVEASRDGRNWVHIDLMEQPETRTFPVPESLLPARAIWVRLKADQAYKVEVTAYAFTSSVGGAKDRDACGMSQYVTVYHIDPSVSVQIADLGDIRQDGRSDVDIIVRNNGDKRIRCETTGSVLRDDETESTFVTSRLIGSGRACRLCISYHVQTPEEHTLRILSRDAMSGRVLFLLEGCVLE